METWTKQLPLEIWFLSFWVVTLQVLGAPKQENPPTCTVAPQKDKHPILSGDWLDRFSQTHSSAARNKRNRPQKVKAAVAHFQCDCVCVVSKELSLPQTLGFLTLQSFSRHKNTIHHRKLPLWLQPLVCELLVWNLESGILPSTILVFWNQK